MENKLDEKDRQSDGQKEKDIEGGRCVENKLDEKDRQSNVNFHM